MVHKKLIFIYLIYFLFSLYYILNKLNKMYTIIADYVWIGKDSNLHSKIKVFNISKNIKSINDITIFPQWNFDGSSTGQSTTDKSDLILNPIYYVKNPMFTNTNIFKYFIVLCEIDNHIDNKYRECLKYYNLAKKYEPIFGIEQEYIILDYNGYYYNNDIVFGLNNKEINDNAILNNYKNYCGVGTNNVYGRKIALEHLQKCLYADILICGINSEVTKSQWEFQIGPLDSISVSCQLWIARYILMLVAEKYNCQITFHPKPLSDVNGSGAHTNFSTKEMREDNGIEHIYKAIDKLSKKHKEHIDVYGKYNELRLVGKCETADINTFKYGDCDRTSSIRIPINVIQNKKGYLEDRRPASNMDPFVVTTRILKTVLFDD